MKQNLKRRYAAQVEGFRGKDGTIEDVDTAIKTIHRLGVERSIRAKGSKRVLN